MCLFSKIKQANRKEEVYHMKRLDMKQFIKTKQLY